MVTMTAREVPCRGSGRMGVQFGGYRGSEGRGSPGQQQSQFHLRQAAPSSSNQPRALASVSGPPVALALGGGRDTEGCALHPRPN